MEKFDRKSHWEKVYATRPLEGVSWYQPNPETSLQFITENNTPKSASIIDIGGGDSFLVDHLLDYGYQDVTVLDISEKAIQRAKKRLGKAGEKVKWITADAANFEPQRQYDLWHDRAAFHFLSQPFEIENYLKAAQTGIKPGGILVIGTFAEDGPTKCSNIEISRYSIKELSSQFQLGFEKLKCIRVDHLTPKNIVQHFSFLQLQKGLSLNYFHLKQLIINKKSSHSC